MRRGASDKAVRLGDVAEKAEGEARLAVDPSIDCRHGKSTAEDCPVCDFGEPE